ncbi:MerR family transcriptional regulator [Streptomyces sp. NPDC004647]|uniref:MerR family transcriptional regulator n=1 Tax=Streptomyces sp. NPDC004647 TaxID=3154671 RepID=UPI00339FDA9A
MRISELSRRSGVPIATIKYYLREGMLPPGRATAANQAEYGEPHVRRLRLIRALIGVRGLSVSATRDILGAISEHESDVHEVLGLALGAKPIDGKGKAEGTGDGEGAGEQGGPGAAEADALVDEMGWQVSEDAPAKSVIAETLETLRSLGLDYDWRSLVPYAELAQQTAVLDLDQLQVTEDPLEQAERAVLLTILLEPTLMALRRLAQENESARRNTD